MCRLSQHVLVLEQLPLSDLGSSLKPDRDVTWREAVDSQPDECPVEWMPAEAPLFKLYTSGSTGGATLGWGKRALR